MRRRTGFIASAIAVTFSLLALIAPTTAQAVGHDAAAHSSVVNRATVNASVVAAGIVATGTDDFTFSSWHSDLVLGRDADGRSTLTTTETIVADFPDFDQNRGIRRAIPTHYDGHTTDIDIVSVTDETGSARNYDAETSDDDGEFLEITIAADDYVHGAQTYVITYTQRNVTLFPDDAADNEFYWEVNGTGWAQPFGSVTATLSMDAALADALNGQASCFQGSASSGSQCVSLEKTETAGGTNFEADAGELGPHEGLTIVVGFDEGTFVPRDDSFLANPFPTIGLIGGILAVLTAIAAWVVRLTRWRNAPGRPTIIAEYLPPKGVNLLVSGDIAGVTTTSMPAQLLSFAVRGNVRVLEAKGKGHYILELVHADGLEAAELALLTDLMPGLTPGTRLDLKKTSSTVTAKIQKHLATVRKTVVSMGLREHKGGALRSWLIAGGVFSLVLAFVGSIGAFATEVAGLWPVLTIFCGVIGFIATLAATAVVRPLTAAGAELRDYLAGLRLYIDLAEADRLRVLQSPAGALTSPYRPVIDSSAVPMPGLDAPDSELKIVKLYERVLPFAVLFGLEKNWSKVLGDYYARVNAEPDWYVGTNGFNAALFATGIGAFASSTTAAWSGSSGSSTSSGFSGGGSVGGGGGGGGGGGV
ncbi:DUF2207 domain-containing protein [Leifsonia sp. A12D58]|uniref:DUF2207 domain-containing protein n=1 Tax=Leifsonia sp. A12D58 TaxID=3397674 RepID=UPI0039DF358F